MKQRMLLMMVAAVLATTATRPAAALWVGIQKEVTPANAKEWGIAVQAAKGKDGQGEPVVHVKIVRQFNRESRAKPFLASLAVRAEGKLVVDSAVTLMADEEERSWCFSISANYLAESKFDIKEVLPPYGDGATLVTYEIKLKDFVAVDEPQEQLRIQDGQATSPRPRRRVETDHAGHRRGQQLFRRGQAPGLGQFHRRQVRTPPSYHDRPHRRSGQMAAEQTATLRVRSAGKLIARCDVPIYTWCGGIPWYFDLSPACVAESVFAISGPDAPEGERNYEIKLSDFPVGEKHPAGTGTASAGKERLRESFPTLKNGDEAADFKKVVELGGIVDWWGETTAEFFGLRFAESAVSDDALKELQQLRGIRSLENFTFIGCREITDAGIKEIVPFKSLNYLRIENCPQITGEGLTAFKDHPRLTDLLFYQGQWLTDEGMKDIAQLTNLKRLWLDDCPRVTDKGFEELKAL